MGGVMSHLVLKEKLDFPFFTSLFHPNLGTVERETVSLKHAAHTQ